MFLHLAVQTTSVLAQALELSLLVQLTGVLRLLRRLPLHNRLPARRKHALPRAHDRPRLRVGQSMSTPSVLHVRDSTRQRFLGHASGPVVARRRPLVSQAVGPDLEEGLGAVRLVERENVRPRAVVPRWRKDLGNTVGEGELIDQLCVGLTKRPKQKQSSIERSGPRGLERLEYAPASCRLRPSSY